MIRSVLRWDDMICHNPVSKFLLQVGANEEKHPEDKNGDEAPCKKAIVIDLNPTAKIVPHNKGPKKKQIVATKSKNQLRKERRAKKEANGVPYSSAICNKWRQKGVCTSRKCSFDHPEEWKGKSKEKK